MPADVPFDANAPGFLNIRIWRDFEFGSLVHLVMTDERLYRSYTVVSARATRRTGSITTDAPRCARSGMCR
jgi:alkaline phosphatase D